MAGFVHIWPKNWVKTAHIFFFYSVSYLPACYQRNRNCT